MAGALSSQCVHRRGRRVGSCGPQLFRGCRPRWERRHGHAEDYENVLNRDSTDLTFPAEQLPGTLIELNDRPWWGRRAGLPWGCRRLARPVTMDSIHHRSERGDRVRADLQTIRDLLTDA